MKYQMENSKKVMIIASILLVILTIGLLVFFQCFKTKEETVAKLEDIEESLVEEPDGEYIDIEELKEQENEEEQNIVEENTQKEKTTNNNNNKAGTMPYYIKVNYGAQVVTVYTKDEQENYTIPVKAMVCSTGVATPTSGVYSIPARWEWLGLQGNVYGHYCTQIKGNILFHSVPYLRRGDPASLEYWEYDKLGTYASAGCIRLTVKDAKWIFNNCGRGTKVEFYSSSTPGPLGKPSAKKISSYPDYLRNWDPTDTNASNPWLTYKGQTTPNTPKNEIKDNTTNTTKNEITNTVQNEIENKINNTITNQITNEIVNNVINEEIKPDTNSEKQNTIRKDKE